MPPDQLSPLTIAAYVVGAVLAIPTFIALVKVIFFVAGASEQLKTAVRGIEELKGELGAFKGHVRKGLDEHGERILLLENAPDRGGRRRSARQVSP